MSNLMKDAEKEIQNYNDMIRDLNRQDGQKRPFADTEIPEKILKNEEYIPVPDFKSESPYLPTDLLADFTNESLFGERSVAKNLLRSETNEKKLVNLIRQMNELDLALVSARYENAVSVRAKKMVDNKFNFIKEADADTKKIGKEIAALKKAEVKALREEEEDNRRLEEALLLCPVPENDRRRYVRLVEQLKKEMEYRDAVNRTLLLFYENANSMKIYEKAKRDATSLAKRSAGDIYRFRVKVRSRQTALLLLDQKTTEIALLEQAKWQKEHTEGTSAKAREAVERDIIRMENNIRVINEEFEAIIVSRNAVTQYDADSVVLPNGSGSFRASCAREEELARFNTVSNMAKIVREIGQIRVEKSLVGTWDSEEPFGKRLNDFPVKF